MSQNVKISKCDYEMCIVFLVFIYTWIFSFFNNEIQIHMKHTQLLTNNKKIQS